MTELASPAYSWLQRKIDCAVLWSFSILLAAVFRLAVRLRRGSDGAEGLC